MTTSIPVSIERRNINFSLIAFESDRRPTKKAPGNKYSYFLCDLSCYHIERYPHPENSLQDIQDFLKCVPYELKGGELTPSLNPDPCGPRMRPEGYGAKFKMRMRSNYYPLERGVEQSVQSVGQPFVFAMMDKASGRFNSTVLEYDDLHEKCLHWWSGNLTVYPKPQTYEEMFGTCALLADPQQRDPTT